MAAKTTDAKQKKSKINGILILQIATVVALLLWMEISVTTGRVSKVFMAAPSGIVEEAVKIISNGTLQPHLLVTLEEVAVGYVLAGVVGVALALLWTLFPKTEAYGSVFCSAIMAIPKTAILPILVLWFGIGFQSKVVLIFLFSVFQILYNTLTGAKQCKEEYLKVARVFRASRVQTVFGVILPGGAAVHVQRLPDRGSHSHDRRGLFGNAVGQGGTWVSFAGIPGAVKYLPDVFSDHPGDPDFRITDKACDSGGIHDLPSLEKSIKTH